MILFYYILLYVRAGAGGSAVKEYAHVSINDSILLYFIIRACGSRWQCREGVSHVSINDSILFSANA